MQNAGKYLAAVRQALELSEPALARRRPECGAMKSEESKRPHSHEDEKRLTGLGLLYQAI